MSNDTINYGPLSTLIGSWEGKKGMDIAPEPDGTEENPYYESIVFTAIGDVTNAESQTLAALHYRQIVKRKSNNKVFHDQTGYWMWDSESGIVMQTLTIPRGVSLIAGGTSTAKSDGSTSLEVSSSIDSKDWGISQAPFMRDNAKTTRFTHNITVKDNYLKYSETTIIEIYGKVFEHTDTNELTRTSP